MVRTDFGIIESSLRAVRYGSSNLVRHLNVRPVTSPEIVSERGHGIVDLGKGELASIELS